MVSRVISLEQSPTEVDISDDEMERLSAARRRLAVDPALYQLAELDVFYEEQRSTLWTFMNPAERPSFTPSMLDDFKIWQAQIKKSFGPAKNPLKYLVLGSRFPGIFCLGGDLDLFVALIRERHRAGLIDYGNTCVRILHQNMQALNLPLITIGMVAGDALGGGFEALLSFDVIVAERGTKFGLPEVAFGLFPGMGAHCVLARRLGVAMAERMILGGESYSAEQMYDLGLVHVLCDAGGAEAAVRAYIAKNERRHSGHVGAHQAMRVVNPVPLEELEAVVEIWADSALRLREADLKLMLKLVAAQTRLSGTDATVQPNRSASVVALPIKRLAS